MSEYKATLNLPQTKFPMKASLANREPKMLEQWQSTQLYQKIRQRMAGREQFILHDGPPYANGNIHIGHAVNKILKDIIIKSKTLSGYDAPYVPGWDCHGLPIELNVEKKVGKAGVKVDAATFRQKCREYAAKQVDGQRTDFKRLGVLGDWEKPYLTMDFNFEADIVRSLGKIATNGHLSKGFKPVHWCLDCTSALAEAEVEYKDKVSPSIDVAFTAVDQAAVARAFGSDISADIEIVIWTTTPWTLPANLAVSLGGEVDYALVKADDRYLVLAEALVESVASRCGFDSTDIVGRAKGGVLAKQLLQHPFYDKQVPVLLGDHVTTDAGTGCVHTAPAHGQEDFVVCQQNGIEVYNPVGANGVYLPDTEIFAGQHVFKANSSVIEELEGRGKLLSHSKFEHSYPHCWRHKSPIIFRATPQWFVGMRQNGLLDQALAEVEKTEWLPEWGRARIDSMINDRPDWCISRQRTWGVPIALFINKQTAELHPETPRLIEEVAQLIEQRGIDAWFDLEPETLLGDEAGDYDKVVDTLDVWFDSGVTHAATLSKNKELTYPADLYLEGSDQHRGWFQSSLLTATAINGSAPYKTCMTHGFVVDEKGQKMSKSLGNVIPPQQVTNSLGADILRLWVAATDYRSEMRASDEIFKRTADSYRRIRNTSRFLLSNLEGFDPAVNQVEADQMIALDRWAVDRAHELQQELIEAFDNYQFHMIYQKIHNFCAVDMGGFYLDIIKDRQYTTGENSLARRSCQTALYLITEALVRWLAPICSFTAEEIWPFIPGERGESVFLEEWYQGLIPMSDNDALGRDYWAQVKQVKIAVNKELEQRRKEVGGSLKAEVTLYCDDTFQPLLETLGDELRFVLITSKATVRSLAEADDSSVATDIEGLKLSVVASEAEKCERCWHHSDTVGTVAAHETLCTRCVDNIEGEGETRSFA
ncbi:Isoleucine--tRNA ligase [Sinobacterium norvegicum]|uniref:Isoleucine--tRNA ligase n=1 Tax=Sinobacterium norvegicum TaxID=1641715 RepID=A0ABN8ELB1_9GAMM|nr:isoleucine--tRNA ligase [Sinobacterium norvegicum]CAH0993201.1 Isoleucine--tRNA ligase [Sinobacterium norvegicum]